MRATLPTRRSRTIGKPSAIRHVPAIRPMRWRFFRRLSPPESLTTQRKRRTEERTAPILRRARSQRRKAVGLTGRRGVAQWPLRRRRGGVRCGAGLRGGQGKPAPAATQWRTRAWGWRMPGDAVDTSAAATPATQQNMVGRLRETAPTALGEPAKRQDAPADRLADIATEQPAPGRSGQQRCPAAQGRRPRPKGPEPTGEARRAGASALRPARQASLPARARSRNGKFPDGGLFRASVPKPRRCRKEIVETCGGALEITDARRHRRAHSLPVSANRTRSKAAGSGRTRAASSAMNRNRPCMNLP